jgi:hypothetical protein
MKHNNIFDILYANEHPIESLGKAYKHPRGGFEHGKDFLVATLPGEGDGQSVEVYECRLPARFFTLKVLAGPNSVGEPQIGYEVGTGSGDGELAGHIAMAIANGMLAFKPKE